MHVSGVCYALFAWDVGFAVDLDRAETRIAVSIAVYLLPT